MKFKVTPYYFLGISLSISLTPSDSLWLPPVNYLLAPIPLASYKEQSIYEHWVTFELFYSREESC